VIALAPRLDRRGPLTVALVNNMPDAAFDDTEAQFRRVLTAGHGNGDIALDLYTLREIPRSERTRAEIAARYADLEVLWERPPDALIVTGTEPVHAQLCDEPYWDSISQLLLWAAEAVPAVMLSCLAAHAGLHVFDGINRVRQATKCCGIFSGYVDGGLEPLARGLPRRVPVPHSRCNEVPQAAIVAAGYQVLIGAGDGAPGWSVAVRHWGEALFVLCQGHPEYSTLSLLREYRRDVRRYLLGHSPAPYPVLPEGYLNQAAVEVLREFERRALHPERDPRRSLREFPYGEIADSVQNTWAGAAATLYGNWLSVARRASAAHVSAT
jgi:homoserine O-succinyltransferase